MVYEKGEEVNVEIPERMNISEILIDEKVKRGKGEKIALRCTGDKSLGIESSNFTYKELQDYIGRTGNAFKNLGIEVDDRILLILLDTPEFITTFYGAIKIGAIPDFIHH